MSLYKRGRIWWCEFEVHGQRHRHSTGKTDRGEARTEEARLRYQAAGRAPRVTGRRGAVPTLTQAAVRDIQDAEDRGRSRGHVASYETMWRNLWDHFGASSPLDVVDHRTLMAYEGARREQGARGQTIRREVWCLRRAFDAARMDGIALEPPKKWPEIHGDPPHPTRKGRLVDRADLRRYLIALPAALREELTVCALTGLRQSELHRLEASWIRRAPAGRGWLLRVPAGGKMGPRDRDVPLPPEARTILLRRAKVVAAGPLFRRDGSNTREILDRAARVAKLDHRVTLRDLRTTYGTTALVATGDAAAVMAAMGHTDLRTTQRYQRSTIERVQRVGAGVAASLALRRRRKSPRVGDRRRRRKAS